MPAGAARNRRLIFAALLLVLLIAGGVIAWRCVALGPRHLHARFGPHYPLGIVIHHTATPPMANGKLVDVPFIDYMHALRGFHVTDPRSGRVYHIGYHFLILQDGSIQIGRPEYLPGSHAKGHPQMFGIALVGNFQRDSNRGRCGPGTPPHAQLQAAILLTRQLMAKYHFSPADVYLHRDLRQTACPGDAFPRGLFYQAISQR